MQACNDVCKYYDWYFCLAHTSSFELFVLIVLLFAQLLTYCSNGFLDKFPIDFDFRILLPITESLICDRPMTKNSWFPQRGFFEIFRNCLFRALADQLYGDSGDRYHMDLRSNTVEYMRRNREDFEPFFDPEYEGVTFDRHLDLLEEDGTFAGKFDNQK